jgi:hypothetical protein
MTNKSENKIIKAKLLVDFDGGLKGQIIFISPGEYAELRKNQIVGEKEEI